jgi:hypothetical protein
MNQRTIVMALFITIGAVLVTGLIATPGIEEADAKKDKKYCGTEGGIISCSYDSKKECKQSSDSQCEKAGKGDNGGGGTGD